MPWENARFALDAVLLLFLVVNGYLTMKLTISIQEMKIFMYTNFVQRTDIDNLFGHRRKEDT